MIRYKFSGDLPPDRKRFRRERAGHRIAAAKLRNINR
jgi:hypothetical protein